MNELHEATTSSDERIRCLIQGELSSPRRWLYRAMLLTTSVVVAAIVSLWVTEPAPLPLRLHVAFAALCCIGVTWVSALVWILTRRHCPSVIDRIVTGWVATGACLMFLVVGTGIALARAYYDAAFWLAATGLTLSAVAIYMLRDSYALRNQLQQRLRELRQTQA